jgi:peroxiredoxin
VPPPAAGQTGSEPPASRRRFIGTPLGNALVIAITAVVIVAGVWLVGEWRAGGNDDAQPVVTDASGATVSGGAVSTIDVGGSSDVPAPAIGQPAADFSMISISGDQVTLSALRGQPVWLVFGATWCTNCRSEAPDVQLISEEFSDRATVVGVYSGEEIATVYGYAQRAGLTYPQLADTFNEITSDYRVIGLPTHFFIDRDGNITKISVGTMTASQARAELTSLL